MSREQYLINTQGPWYLEFISKINWGSADLTSELSLKLGDLWLEYLHNFSCSEDFSISKQVLINVSWNIQYW